MSAAATPPPRIPDYELIRLIGSGSYGDVWLARAITGAFRAVKIVWRDRFPDLRPFAREFEGITRFATISLREPSQLALLHAGRNEAEGYFYYVMELADDAAHGRSVDPETYQPLTLREVFAQRGRLPASEVVALGVALARALASLHAAGLVHRDVKPSNVIFVGGVPKLADVGLVAAASNEQLTFVGTEGFVPPEGPGAPGADVFSLGKLLYELATGLDRHDFPRLPAELSEWPDRREFLELNEVLLRACEGDARRRYPDATALLDELLLLQAGKSVRRLRRTERHLARTLRVAAVLAIVAAVAGTGAWVERRRANAEQALRAVAEAERDEMVRRTLYANTIGNAQHALRTGGYGKARQLLRELVPAAGQEDLRGFEWEVLWKEAQGDPSQVLAEAGPAIWKLAPAPDGSLVAVLRANREIALLEAATGRPQRTIPGAARLAGFSADGQLLLGNDAEGRLRAWRVADGSIAASSPAGAGNYLLGMLADAELAVLKNGRPAELTVWDGATGRSRARLTIDTAADAWTWEFFRGAVSARRHEAVIAWIKGRSGTNFRLTLVDLNGSQPPRTHLVDRRVMAVGYDAAGPWAILAEDRRLWRPDATGLWQATSERLPANTQQIASDEEGRRITSDGEQLCWLDAAGNVVRIGRGPQGVLGAIAVVPGSGTVYSGTSDGELRIWPRTPGGQPAVRMDAWNAHAANSEMVFSGDSATLAVPLDGHTVGMVDRDTLEVRARIAGLRYPAWFGDGRLLGPADDGAGVRRGAANGSGSECLLPGAEGVLQVHASRDGRVICATDSRGRLWVQHADAAPTVLVADGFQNRFTQELDAAGQFLWHTGRDNQLRCLRLADGREVWSVTLPTLAPEIELSPDGAILAVPLESGRLELRRAATGELVRAVQLGGSTPQCVCYSPDGRRFFVAGSKGDITVWETARWLQLNLFQLPAEDAFHWMTMAPDASALAVMTKTGALHVLRAR